MAIITKTFKIGIGDDETSVQPSADKIVKRDSNGDILTYRVGFYDAPNDEYQYVAVYDDVFKVGDSDCGFEFDFYNGLLTNHRVDTQGTSYDYQFPNKSGTIALLSDIPSSTDTYHTPIYNSGLKIGTGTGVADMYVPLGSVASGNTGLIDGGTIYSYITSYFSFGSAYEVGITSTSDTDTLQLTFSNDDAYFLVIKSGTTTYKLDLENTPSNTTYTISLPAEDDVILASRTWVEKNAMQYKNTSSVSNLNSLTSVVANREKMDGNIYILTDSGNLSYYSGSLAVKQNDMVMFSYGGGTQWGWRLLPTLYSEQTFTGKKTFSFSGSDTPMIVQTTYSSASASYIEFKKNNSTFGYIGVNSSHKPVFYDSSEKEIALEEDVAKNLYHLGAFDTYTDNGDGTTTITRRTGYLTSENLLSKTWTYQSGNGRWYTPHGMSVDTSINEPVYTKPSGLSYINYDNTNLLLYTSISNTSQFYSLLASLNIQIKLSSSYTETVITGRPINTLDKASSDWVRDEYNKTLNLWNEVLYQGGWNNPENSKYSHAKRVCNANHISVKPNTTYSISNSGGRQIVANFRDSSQTYINGTSWANSPITFITPSNCVYLDIIFKKSDDGDITPADVGNIMLNKGNHAYPYQDYKGEVVHRGKLFDIYEMAGAKDDVDDSPSNAQLPTYNVGGLSRPNKSRLFNIIARCVEKGYMKAYGYIIPLTLISTLDIGNENITAIFGSYDDTGNAPSFCVVVSVSGTNYNYDYYEV